MTSIFLWSLLAASPMQSSCMRVAEVQRAEVQRVGTNISDDIGPEFDLLEGSFFEGLQMESASTVWARDIPGNYWTTISATTKKNTDHPIFSALYNHVTAVSDIVTYELSMGDFEVGGGRGSGWKEDDTLKLAYNGKRKEYATRVDYNGVGHFAIDRGHQCPVGSFNAVLERADKTNMPTNLSPQSVELNQKKWRYLEAEIREKASSDYLTMEDGSEVIAEVATGPLYELPPAFYVSGESEDPPIEAGKEKWEEQIDSWCNTDDGYVDMEHPWLGTAEAYQVHKGKSWINCLPVDATKPLEPNNMWMEFVAKPKATPLRIPLGYFKVFVIPMGTPADKDQHIYCAFVMDQTGQCMLTNIESIADVARLDLSTTSLMQEPHRTNPYFCLPPGGVLRKRNACAYFHKKDLNTVTAEEVLRWRKHELESDPL